MTGAKLAAARHVVAEDQLTMTEIAATVGVSRTTLYRHLSATAAVQDDELRRTQ